MLISRQYIVMTHDHHRAKNDDSHSCGRRKSGSLKKVLWWFPWILDGRQEVVVVEGSEVSDTLRVDRVARFPMKAYAKNSF